MPKRLNWIGMQSGRLTVVALGERKRTGARGYSRVMLVCQCECGNTASVMATNFRAGLTKSCGCLRRETGRAAGQARKGTTYTQHTPRPRTPKTPKPSKPPKPSQPKRAVAERVVVCVPKPVPPPPRQTVEDWLALGNAITKCPPSDTLPPVDYVRTFQRWKLPLWCRAKSDAPCE